jgi:hypothetical protein
MTLIQMDQAVLGHQAQIKAGQSSKALAQD